MLPMLPLLRRRVHEVLEIPSRAGDRLGRAADIGITALILLNVGAVMLETVHGVQSRYGSALMAFEWFSIGVFGVEYLLRLWTAVEEPRFQAPVGGRARWMVTPLALVDLLAILPALLFVLDLRFLRALRLLRLLKLGRYSRSTRVLARLLRKRREELVMSFVVVMMGLLLTASLMFHVEHEAQPEAFSSIPAALWWAIVTITAVGYGDVVPVTPVGRVLGGATALLGVALLALPVGILAGGYMDALEQERENEREAAAALRRRARSQRGARGGADECPNCGYSARAASRSIVSEGPP